MGTQPIDLASVLDDDHRAVLEMLPPGLLDFADIDTTRAGLDALMSALPTPEMPAGVTIDDVMVPGPEGDPEVMVRCYRPEAAAAPSAALYWIHGGGMVLGSVDSNDFDCARRAAEFNVPVFSVEYRLAPEHPFPAPVEDCYAGLVWLADQAPTLGVDPDRIVVAGASAGGGLAAGVTILARDRGGPSIAYQLLVFPMLDHRNELPSTHNIVDSRVWNRDANLAGWGAYLGDLDRSAVPPAASPAMADDLRGLPPAYINVGQYDLFLDEDIAYARALLAAGVPCELKVYPGAFHGSSAFVPASPISQRWVRDEDEALRTALGA